MTKRRLAPALAIRTTGCTKGAQDACGRDGTQWTEADDGPDYLDGLYEYGRTGRTPLPARGYGFDPRHGHVVSGPFVREDVLEQES